jgi:hypothetical protein
MAVKPPLQPLAAIALVISASCCASPYPTSECSDADTPGGG